jgi:hypothetical protein
MMLKTCTRVAAIVFTCSQIVACGSTTEYEDAAECSPQREDVCEDSGKDRGFDPCLVNDKLPVCSSK